MEKIDLTAKELAARLRVSDKIVRMWAGDGKIPVRYWYRLPGGREFRFRPEVIDYIRRSKAA